MDIDLAEEDAIDDPLLGEPPIVVPAVEVGQPVLEKEAALAPLSKHRSLATPAVRRITRELGINITDVTGTGKEGRVLKEDVVRFAHDLEFNKPPTITQTSPPAPLHRTQVSQDDETVPLTQIQSHMFKVMTQSLAIPHFLYSDEIVLDALSRVRTNLNQTLAFQASPGGVSKLTFMPFFIKALSEALSDYPLINSRLDLTGERPQLVKRPQHNIGIAMDTPIGLIVPNIKNVAHLSILDIAAELQRLQAAGAAGKLSLADLSGGTITISNIGNIGGTVTAPVIVPSEVAIVGIGRARVVPAFDSEGKVVPRTVVNFSWSADHRIVDGATMARMAASLREMIQEPEKLLVRIR